MRIKLSTADATVSVDLEADAGNALFQILSRCMLDMKMKAVSTKDEVLGGVHDTKDTPDTEEEEKSTEAVIECTEDEEEAEIPKVKADTVVSTGSTEEKVTVTKDKPAHTDTGGGTEDKGSCVEYDSTPYKPSSKLAERERVGLFSLACPRCGKVNIIRSDKEIDSCTCHGCNETFNVDVEQLAPIEFKCPTCGKIKRQWTNIEGAEAKTMCQCRAPVSCYWDSGTRSYHN